MHIISQTLLRQFGWVSGRVGPTSRLQLHVAIAMVFFVRVRARLQSGRKPCSVRAPSWHYIELPEWDARASLLLTWPKPEESLSRPVALPQICGIHSAVKLDKPCGFRKKLQMVGPGIPAQLEPPPLIWSHLAKAQTYIIGRWLLGAVLVGGKDPEVGPFLMGTLVCTIPFCWGERESTIYSTAFGPGVDVCQPIFQLMPNKTRCSCPFACMLLWGAQITKAGNRTNTR